MTITIANQNRKARAFNFYYDASHGWLFVPWAVLQATSINPNVFSEFSYADEEGVYLEEDIDFPLFDRLFSELTNQRIVLHDVEDMHGDVRWKKTIKVYLNEKKRGS